MELEESWCFDLKTQRERERDRKGERREREGNNVGGQVGYCAHGNLWGWLGVMGGGWWGKKEARVKREMKPRNIPLTLHVF